MTSAAKVFHGLAAVMFGLALMFFADALGAPVYRKLAAAWAWLNTAVFIGLGLFALFLAHLSEELSRIERRLDRIEAALARRQTQEGKDVSGING